MEPIYTRIYTQPVEFNRALGFAYDALVHGPYPFDALAAWKGLSERVAQGIYMGQGLLLPHTRVPGLKGPLMAFVVCKEGFTGVKTRNEESAQFMCMLLSPAESAMAHTVAISNVAKLLLNPEWKEKVLAATDEETLKQLF
ncbi:MAG: PTS sugar transporter subunit IIA [Fibrobacter sp.]|nr:PTS sugar transporter subunit IIA [Fibrobacter sp.]